MKTLLLPFYLLLMTSIWPIVVEMDLVPFVDEAEVSQSGDGTTIPPLSGN